MTILYIYIEQTMECIDTIVADTMAECQEIAKQHYDSYDYKWIRREPDDIAMCELDEPKNKYDYAMFCVVDFQAQSYLTLCDKYNFNRIHDLDNGIRHTGFNNDIECIDFYYRSKADQEDRHNKETQTHSKATGTGLLSRLYQSLRKLWS